MSLIDKIRADQLQARKNRESEKSLILTTLIGEAGMIGKNAGNRESTDEEVTGVIRKFLKGNSENKRIATDCKDSVWLSVLEAERELLESYLPKQLTADEIREKLQGIELSKPVMMKHLKDNYAGLYDGRTASQIVDDLIKG